MQLYYFVLYFYVYGFLGWCTEVAYATIKEKRFVNRGFLSGPICPVYGIGVGTVVLFLSSREWSIVALYVVATVLVTTIEGITGYLMDKLFHHKWWDYSNQPLNIGGYVCLLFSLAWGVACVLIVRVIHPIIYKGILLIPFTVGMILAVLLGIALFADIYTTTAEILKLNKKLESMEKIATELKEVSDMLGENIHENVMETLEHSEEARTQLDLAAAELREKLDVIAEEKKERREEEGILQELKARYADLKRKYAELSERSGMITRRLMEAFPKMESRLYKERLIELKGYIWRR